MHKLWVLQHALLKNLTLKLNVDDVGLKKHTHIFDDVNIIEYWRLI